MPPRPKHREAPSTRAAAVAVAALAAALALALPAAAHAQTIQVPQEPPPDFQVGFFGSGATGHADGLDKGTGFGGSAAGFFTRNLGVEVGFRRMDLDVEPLDASLLSGGSMTTDLVTAGVVARFPTGGSVTPWVTGGIAWFRNDFEIDPAVAGPLAEFNFVAVEEVDDVLGFNAGAGVDVRVARSFGVFGEARYVAAESDTLARLEDRITGIATENQGSQDLGALTFAGGVRIIF